MKVESTIRRQRRELRRFIEEHRGPDEDPRSRAVAEAYAMESALTWVLNRCGWSPLSIVTTELDRR